jgi:hypothetical protein
MSMTTYRSDGSYSDTTWKPPPREMQVYRTFNGLTWKVYAVDTPGSTTITWTRYDHFPEDEPITERDSEEAETIVPAYTAGVTHPPDKPRICGRRLARFCALPVTSPAAALSACGPPNAGPRSFLCQLTTRKD